MTYNNFLYSGYDFDEDEDLLRFKFKMLNSILLIIAFFCTLFAAISDMGVHDIGQTQTFVNYITAGFMILLILFLRRSKDNYTKVSNVLIVALSLTFTMALITVPQDEFRIIWFHLLVFAAYIFNGNRNGLFFTLSSIIIILTVHMLTDLQLSQIAINTGIITLVIASFLFHVYTSKISSYENTLHEKNASLEVLASTDGLTGIMNKRIFNEVSERYFYTAQRHQKELTLLLLDLDHFKKVNDNHGHNIGDLLLIRFVETIQALLRKSDVFARVGGEEFAILLFKTDVKGAKNLAEKIRLAVEEIIITSQDYDISITTSIGITPTLIEDKTFTEIFARCDRALYRAKEAGRNQSFLVS